MNKIKFQNGGPFVNTVKPSAGYLIRMEMVANTLLFRYFKVLTDADMRDREVEEGASPPQLQPGRLGLLRQIVRERVVYRGKMVTKLKDYQESPLEEIGRHFFSPELFGSIGGAAERDDFAVIAMPFGTDGMLAEPYNAFAEGGRVKGRGHRLATLKHAQPVFYIGAVKTSAPLARWTVAYADMGSFVLDDITPGAWSSAAPGFSIFDMMPKVAISGPASVRADERCEMTVSLIAADGSPHKDQCELVVEAVSGYAPITRVTTSANGVATFRMRALDLVAGDKLRVKVGTKSISGLAELIVPVV